MKFTGTLTTAEIDMAAFKSAMNKTLTEAIQAAAREWLNATAATIPVWSGASVRTFRELASAVSYPLSVSPKRGSFNTDGDPGDNTGRLTTDSAAGKYGFEYSTTLFHLVFNEYYDGNTEPGSGVIWRLHRPGPYHFQQRGQEAFLAFARNVRLPNPFNYLRIRLIPVR